MEENKLLLTLNFKKSRSDYFYQSYLNFKKTFFRNFIILFIAICILQISKFDYYIKFLTSANSNLPLSISIIFLTLTLVVVFILFLMRITLGTYIILKIDTTKEVDLRFYENFLEIDNGFLIGTKIKYNVFQKVLETDKYIIYSTEDRYDVINKNYISKDELKTLQKILVDKGIKNSFLNQNLI